MRLFFKSDFRSLYLLNATQFLGALNDNIFKLLIVYLLISVKGPLDASSILAIAGMVFVIPFLLFSNASGVLADRISKRSIIVGTKFAEVIIMTLGFLAFFFKLEIGSYFLLFLMATQSAVFGPSKFGIIPELVDEKKVSKANGLLSSFTYLAIIFGTFLASFITDVTNKNFLLASGMCILISLIGLTTSFGIVKTEPKRSKKKINPFFFYEIYQTLKMSSHRRHLFSAIIGSAFFLFLGGYVQMNIIPLAIQSLNMTEIGGGYLFLTTAVGIALGSILAGKLSKDRVEPGISCIAAFMLSLLFICLYLFASSFVIVITLLILLGVAGGVMLIPLDSFIQVSSPDLKRGQVIAASNFLSFSGVLMAAIILYILGEKLKLSAATGFAIIGLITFFFGVFLTGRMASYFFPYIMQHFVFRWILCELPSKVPSHPSIICCTSEKWIDALILFPFINRLKILVPGTKLSRFPWLNSLFSTMKLISCRGGEKEMIDSLMQGAAILQKREFHTCFFLKKDANKELIKEAYKKHFGRFHTQLYFLHVDKRKIISSASFRRNKSKWDVSLEKN